MVATRTRLQGLILDESHARQSSVVAAAARQAGAGDVFRAADAEGHVRDESRFDSRKRCVECFVAAAQRDAARVEYGVGHKRAAGRLIIHSTIAVGSRTSNDLAIYKAVLPADTDKPRHTHRRPSNVLRRKSDPILATL